MRSLISLLALATLALGAPSLSVESGPLSVSTSVVDDSLTVHIVRTDDLLSDDLSHHDRSLLLERLTHVELRVSLNEEGGSFVINNEKIDLSGLSTGGEEQPRQVQAVKAQAFSLAQAETIDGRHYTSDELTAFVSKNLPKGIVGTEVTIVEDRLEETALNDVAEESSADGARVSMKSYSVYVRITEVDDVSIAEQQDVSHDSTILIPILRVELTFNRDDGKPVKMHAISVRPPRPARGGKGKGPARQRPSFADRRPSRSGKSDREHYRAGKDQRRPHHDTEEDEEPPHGPPSHQRPPPPPSHDGQLPPPHDSPRPPPRGPPRSPPRGRPGPPRRGPPRHHSPEDDVDEPFGRHGHDFEHHGPHPRHHHHHGPPAFVRWIAARLGIPPPPPHHFHQPPHSHPYFEEGEEDREGHGRMGRRPLGHSQHEDLEGEVDEESPRFHQGHLSPEGVDISVEEMEHDEQHAMHELLQSDEIEVEDRHPHHGSGRRPLLPRPDFDGPHFPPYDGPRRHHHFHHGPHRHSHPLAHSLRHCLHSTLYLAEGIAQTPAFFAFAFLVKLLLVVWVGRKVVQLIRRRRERRVEESLAQEDGEKEVLPKYVDEEVAVQEKV